MNKFTKEELQYIYDAVMDTEIPMLGYLPTKIESMIDNYPEICGLCNRYDCQECPCR